ncbi:MAG TPA: transglutaminase-like domain-containing protein [Burkholderiaceae bacterium]|nr:transglutaminase-like domain-containing protein [Burkholderiaceae bacterium]
MSRKFRRPAMSESRRILSRFDASFAPPAKFLFGDAASPYLTRLRSEFGLDGIVSVASGEGDLERVRRVVHWASGLWEHDGGNVPARNDPLSILREAAEGKRFRCVEFSIVLAGALAALGYRSRTLSLMTADVETREFGAGHVVAEVQLPDCGTWVMLDAEFDAVPLVRQRPSNAVQLADALCFDPDAVEILSMSVKAQADYVGWIEPYLHYFSAALDNRYDVKRETGVVRVAPTGSSEPRVFQRVHPLPAATLFTHHPCVLYPALA